MLYLGGVAPRAEMTFSPPIFQRFSRHDVQDMS